MTLLWADDRAYLTTGRTARYTLGDPTAPDLTFNTVDTDGCAWLVDEPKGWRFPSVTVPMDRRQSGHGGYAGEPTFEPRTLTVEGTVTAPTPDALDAAHGRLMAALLGRLPAQTRWTHADEGGRGLWVYTNADPSWANHDDRAADFGFVLIAEDPIKTGPAVPYGPVRLPGNNGGLRAAAGGFRSPWVATAGVVGRIATTAANPGDQESHAIYTITGPVPAPRVLLGTGAYVWLDLDLGELDTAVIDTAGGSVQVNGVNRYDAWGAGSVFPLIPPGGTQVRLLSGGGGSDPAAALTLTTGPSWK
jgi:hypothetical protein